MYGSGTAQGLFSFTRLNALFFSVWASLSSGSNYVCQSFLPCFVLLIFFFFFLIRRSLVVSSMNQPSTAGIQGTEHLAFPWIRTHTLFFRGDLLPPTCHLTSSRSQDSGLCLFFVCNRAYFVVSTYLTRVVSSIPSAIRRASPSLTYQAKCLRRCWKQYAISLFLLRIL
jgi:hypothetical protein